MAQMTQMNDMNNPFDMAEHNDMNLFVNFWPEDPLFHSDAFLADPSPSADTSAGASSLAQMAFFMPGNNNDTLPLPGQTFDNTPSDQATRTAPKKASDSGIGLNSWTGTGNHMSIEPVPFEINSRRSSTSASPASHIFSAEHSPINHYTDFYADKSPTSSPEAGLEMRPTKEVSTPRPALDLSSSSEAIVMPQSVDSTAELYIIADKHKTRAETQIKATLVLDPGHYEYVRFPIETLSKPKQFATDAEKEEVEGHPVAVMKATIVCASAIDTPEGRERAIRRTMGLEPFPKRDAKVQVTELDKDDERHPQNGGAVVICEGCKERERKRYDRKKKKTLEDYQFHKYESERVIMINEREFKKFEDMETSKQKYPDQPYSNKAKQIPFNLRLCCYGRHQGDASQGFCVVFVLTDMKTDETIATKVTDTFHITDDHKTKEMTINIPQAQQAQAYHVAVPQQTPTFNTYPQQGYMPMSMFPPAEQQYANPAFSQPTTPVLTNYQNPISPLDGSMHRSMAQLAVHQHQPSQHPSNHMPQFTSPPSATTGSFHGLPQQPAYGTNVLNYLNMGSLGQLTRPQSMDNFAVFQNVNMAPGHDFVAQSAPPSLSSTPLTGLSRPASPSFDNGLPTKRHHRGYTHSRQDGL